MVSSLGAVMNTAAVDTFSRVAWCSAHVSPRCMSLSLASIADNVLNCLCSTIFW